MERKTTWYVPVLSTMGYPGERRGEASSMASQRDYETWHRDQRDSSGRPEVLVAKFFRNGFEMEAQVRRNREV